MAIEKPMTPSSLDVEGSEDVKIEVVNPDAISIGDEEIGMIIDFTGEMTEELTGPEHDANLAEFIDDRKTMESVIGYYRCVLHM